MVFTKEKWKSFTAFCWYFFGVGSFWPVLFILIIAGLGIFNSVYRYSQSDVDEMRIEYENKIDHAREDSYQFGYSDAEFEHEEDWSDGYLEGFYDGYYAGYDDSDAGDPCDPSVHY